MTPVTRWKLIQLKAGAGLLAWRLIGNCAGRVWWINPGSLEDTHPVEKTAALSNVVRVP